MANMDNGDCLPVVVNVIEGAVADDAKKVPNSR
jgi:hypothetical protein